MRILWFNWRDIKNPEAGGAEVFTHEVMRRLVCQGYEATLFTAEFDGCLATENVDGVNIVRSGNKYSVYNKAKSFYNSNGSKYDLIIDEINTRPFLTPKFVNDKLVIALFHQLAKEFWFYETSFPLNYLGYYYFEKKWLSYYRDIPTITISESSKKDLESLGFKKIFLAPEGLNVTPLREVGQKELVPTVVFIGRLKKAKLPHHAIQAFSLIKKEIPDARMWVIGDGYMRKELERMSGKDITFLGRVPNDQKNDLLSRAHLVLVPAVREGWGLVVTDSYAMGTPVVAYNVPGLRDSVRDGKTGVLTKRNTPDNLASEALQLLRNRTSLKELSINALEFSRQFSWDKTSDTFAEIIKQLRT